jgi:hypothetical protein
MRNRPGRLFYMLEYKGLDQNFIVEYCEAKLNAKKHINLICRISGLFESFNFDILKALVEEMNRYNEDPIKALDMLNAKPGSDERVEFDITLSIKGKDRERGSYYPNTTTGLPIGKEHEITVYGKKTVTIDLNESTLKDVDTEKGIYVYQQGDYKFTMTRRPEVMNNYYKHLA